MAAECRNGPFFSNKLSNTAFIFCMSKWSKTAGLKSNLNSKLKKKVKIYCRALWYRPIHLIQKGPPIFFMQLNSIYLPPRPELENKQKKTMFKKPFIFFGATILVMVCGG
jgi:hypothetical protein